DQLFYRRSADLELRRQFAEQARRDWTCFLSERALELVPGGALVVIQAMTDAAGDSGADQYLDLPQAALSELVRDGIVHRHELERMLIPNYLRSEAELLEPLAGEVRT